MQQVGVPRERFPGEKRVAATPDSVTRLQKLGFTVVVERDAGAAAGYSDTLYKDAGASLADADDVWSTADVVVKVRAPDVDAGEVAKMRAGQTTISFVQPAQNGALLDAVVARGATLIAMEQIPRITRAQKMDALSSMANIAGYRAVIEAAHVFPRLFAGQITAAGKMPPAKVLIIGAGVAGLAAIGAARGLGALVRAFDTRAAVREQVQSMGAEFIELSTLTGGGVVESGDGGGGYAKEMSKAFIDAEMELFRAQAKEIDVVITTALIPGRPAPKLWLADMVSIMRAGSVVVDMAAEQGGNCELTKPGELATAKNATGGDVSIVGYTDLASRMAAQASQLYGTNIVHLLDDMTKPKEARAPRAFRVDFDDDVVRAATVVKNGALTWPPPKREAAAPIPPMPSPPDGAPATTPKPSSAFQYPLAPEKPATEAAATTLPTPPTPTPTTSPTVTAPFTPKPTSHAAPSKPPPQGHHAPSGTPSTWPLLVAGALLLLVGVAAPPAFLAHLIVFVLACFVGYQVIWSVAPALHTPLMSVTNAISGIILVGGLLHASDGADAHIASTALGGIVILVAMVNIAGGFLVTQRMLKMFRRGGG